MSEDSQSNYPQGIPNTKKLSCGIDLRLGQYLTDQTAAIDEVCRLLKRPRMYVDEWGYEREIVGGATADQNRRLAWVECRSKEVSENGVDVDFHLRATIDGTLVIDWKVETYNPYFGCHVQLMRWYSEHLILVYHEKHLTIVASISLEQEVRLFPIDVKWEAVGESILYKSEEPELFNAIGLPDLDLRLPVPFELLATTAHENWQSVLPHAEQGRLPTDGEAIQHALRQHLFGASPPYPVADLLIGSLAYPFWDHWPKVVGSYDVLRRRRSLPIWLPFYWGLHLSEGERQPYLRTLDQLAECPLHIVQPDWDQQTCACELAASYIGSRAKVIAASIRAGHLPQGVNCYFWLNWSLAHMAVDLHSLPSGFWHALDVLVSEKKRWQQLCENQSERNHGFWSAEFKQLGAALRHERASQ